LLDAGNCSALGLWLSELRKVSPLPVTLFLPGPVGETNTLRFAERGPVLSLARELAALLRGFGMALAAGNSLVVTDEEAAAVLAAALPALLWRHVTRVARWWEADCAAVLVGADAAPAVRQHFAEREGRLIPVIETLGAAALPRLLVERTLSVNDAAAGRNAALMTI
jgi:RHH-type proline utilization regulon transcriptional repressor/proline dehydrogenase/delta 1-pyrroline-5-carboxylate dehydrogenase